jgi:glycerol kinase
VSSPLLLGIDEGTTAVKVGLFQADLSPMALARRSIATAHPSPGIVEQDPEAMLEAVIEAVAEVLGTAPAGAEVLAGLAHQGESVLAWDTDGRALSPILVWQDKRQEALLAEIESAAVERSGLPLDPYFSAGKLAWLLREDAAVAAARERGVLRLGTVDCFLAERLGAGYATDLSTASRTQLLAVGGRDWDRQLIDAFGLAGAPLPRLRPSFGRLGRLACESWPRSVSLSARVVDQQAALAGSGAVLPGQAKATYGTGVFVLGRTAGPEPVEGLLPTVAWAAPDGAGAIGEISYALDGGVFTAGALLEWLATDLGLAADPRALAAAAATVPDSAGVSILPALAGLGAPWWRPASRAVIAGLHGGVKPAHIARAALEAIAWRVTEIVESLAQSGEIDTLRVDGGLTNDETLLALQADFLGRPLSVGEADATVLGAALLAGVGGGVFATVQDGAALLPARRTVEPRITAQERMLRRERWRAFATGAAALGA